MNKDTLKVLVVDDEPFILKLTAKVLNNLGYRAVDALTDGHAALNLITTADTPFNIIICDLNMPGMDGVEFIRHVCETSFSGGIVLLSGEDQRMLDSTLDLARAFKLNVLGAMQKPLKPELLNEMLERYSPAKNGEEVDEEIDPITGAEMQTSRTTEFANELTLFYQPKVSMKTGEVVGMETLARWTHEQRGLLGPQAFIPLAERIGLIDELSTSLYRQALVQTAEFAKMGYDLKCSINFSINSFNSPGFTDFIVDTAQTSGVPPDRVVLEITESQVMENALNCLEVIMRLRLKKFGLSIDDFGTGNSSMAQLKKIPFNELKLDHLFVHGAAENKSALAILESSVELGKKLGMSIVAEGVETKEDWDVVENLGCDIVQGFYCSKPLNPSDFIQFLENWNGPHSTP